VHHAKRSVRLEERDSRGRRSGTSVEDDDEAFTLLESADDRVQERDRDGDRSDAACTGEQ